MGRWARPRPRVDLRSGQNDTATKEERKEKDTALRCCRTENRPWQLCNAPGGERRRGGVIDGDLIEREGKCREPLGQKKKKKTQPRNGGHKRRVH